MARATSVEGSVHVDGLRELRKTLKLTDTGLVTDMRFVLKGAAEIVAARSRGLAPHKTGALAESIKPGTSGTSALVRSINRTRTSFTGAAPPAGAQARCWRVRVRDDQTEPVHLPGGRADSAAVASEVQVGLDQIIRRAGWH
jgi:hypothetical protein